jgi:hypothetical protein
MRIDWLSKLQHLLQVLGFCLAVAAIQVAFLPDRPYGPPATYSLFIGLFTWAIIDLGRHLFPSALETGWPTGLTGLALVLGGIVVGYLLGNLVADLLCRTFDLYHGTPKMDRATELRNSILITGMAGVAGSYYFYTINKSAYLERKMTEARRQASESRLKLLETQLEPHMLFNTLANLRALIGVDPVRAQTMLDHMIAYLRATLSASRASTHTLEQEFARLTDYLALMAIRMGPRLQYTLELPGALHTLPVPPLLLQPLVENSIRHGLEPKVEGGRITVRAHSNGSTVTLEVEDTGLGLGGTDTGGSHFGLAQVRERLATVYGAAGTMDLIAGHAGGVRASITFPLNS